MHHVQTAADLRSEWFAQAEIIGITAGTSTPDEVINDVEQGIRELEARPHEQPVCRNRAFDLNAV